MLLVENLLMSGGGSTDPYFENVVLLLHGDGTNGGQNNTFIDSSSNNFTITRNGNTTQGSFNPYGTLWSNYFEWTGANATAYVTVPISGALQSAMASATQTREFWLYRTAEVSAVSYVGILRGSSGDQGTIQMRNNTLNLNSVGATEIISVSIDPYVPKNTWVHVAMSQGGGTVKLYVDGVERGSSNTVIVSAPGGPLQIGGANDMRSCGYLSNIRISNIQRYTTTFTPPTANFIPDANTVFLAAQSNRFLDTSSSNLTFTRVGTARVSDFAPFAPSTVYTSAVGGSAYIDGNGDTLVTPATAAFAYGTGDFTYETWVYPESTPNDSYIIAQPSAGAGFPLFTIYNGALHWLPGAGSYQAFALSVTNGQWNHIAAVRQSGTVYGFLNGVRGSTSHVYTTSLGSDRFIRVCEGNRYKGYLSDTHISNVAVYTTTTYTIPTSKVAATSSTNLLLNYTNAAIFDSAAKNDLETVDNAQIDTTTKKFGTGSLEFDGTGDWLLLPDNPNLQLGTGNLTVEFWVYLATGDAGSNRGLVSKGTASTGWSVSLDTTQKVVFSYAASTITASGAITLDAWNHIAVVRAGTGANQTKIYINGTNDGTGTVSTDFNQTNAMYIGANRAAGDPMKGFIDELRITKGVARYTANFTPPTRPFPDK